MKHYHTHNGITFFLNAPPENYETLSLYLTAHVGAVPSVTKAGQETLLLGSKRVMVPQGGPWIRQPNGVKCRIFVHCKTRKSDPMFLYPEAVEYDGSIIGIRPTSKAIERFKKPEVFVEWFNSLDFAELGVYNAGRFQFSQRLLENLLVPVDNT